MQCSIRGPVVASEGIIGGWLGISILLVALFDFRCRPSSGDGRPRRHHAISKDPGVIPDELVPLSPLLNHLVKPPYSSPPLVAVMSKEDVDQIDCPDLWAFWGKTLKNFCRGR